MNFIKRIFKGRFSVPLLALTMLCLLTSRRWCQLVSPQIWDEDGTQIVCRHVAHGWPTILEPASGYLILLPQLISALALRVSLLYYPAVSTIFSWLFIVSVGLAIALAPTRLRGKYLCAVSVFAVPSDPEVFGLPLYTFWWAALLLFLLAVWDESHPAVGWRLCFLLLGGLSSPVIILVLPILYLRVYLYRTLRCEYLIAAVATVIALIQGHFIAGGMAGPAPHLGFEILKIVPVFFGKFLLNTNHNFIALSVLGAGLAALVCVWFYENRRGAAAWILLFLLAGSMALSVVRGGPTAFEPGNMAPRYFFFPWVLTFWILIQHFQTASAPWSRRLVAVVVVFAVVNAIPKWSRRHDDLNWAAHIRSCRLYADYSMPVHYNGNKALAWHFNMSGQTCDEWLERDWLAGQHDVETLPTFAYRVIHVSDDRTNHGVVKRVGGSMSGSDSQKSQLDGYHVVGSFHDSDAETGEVLLQLQRGDRILYRSGVGKGGQSVTIQGCERDFVEQLPIAKEWVTLEFSNPRLPAEFVVTIQDEGRAKGEWSAVAFRDGSQRE